ncbi:hypothetical protein D3C81_2332110 [compost metagenome]
MVGVPVILYLRPNSMLRCRAVTSQLAAAAGASVPLSMWLAHSLAESLAHQMLRDFSTESGLRIG